MNATKLREDRHEFMNPHAIGGHSAACDEDGHCVEGVEFDWSGAIVLDTPEKVAEANALMERWGWDYLDYWQLGDSCFFRVTA